MSLLIKAWGPAFLWCTLIFLFSTDTFSSTNTSHIINPLILRLFPDASAELLEGTHHFARKLAHWSEYFVLAVLLVRGFRVRTNRWDRSWLGWTFVLLCLYALGDEFHQTFVSTRTPAWKDVTLDIFGGVCGTLWVYLVNRNKYRG